MSAMFIPLASGLLGVLIGSLLTYYLGLRRERWNFKRDLYCRLLQSLGELRECLLVSLRHRQLALEGKTEQDPKDNKARYERMMRADDEIQKARYVAAVMLSRRAADALDNLELATRKAARSDTFEGFLKDHHDAAAAAYQVLVLAAKHDLRL